MAGHCTSSRGPPDPLSQESSRSNRRTGLLVGPLLPPLPHPSPTPAYTDRACRMRRLVSLAPCVLVSMAAGWGGGLRRPFLARARSRVPVSPTTRVSRAVCQAPAALFVPMLPSVASARTASVVESMTVSASYMRYMRCPRVGVRTAFISIDFLNRNRCVRSTPNYPAGLARSLTTQGNQLYALL